VTGVDDGGDMHTCVGPMSSTRAGSGTPSSD
jgi:hypothetical protein